MKLLIALVVIIAVVWLVRAARKDTQPDKKPPSPPQRPASQVGQGEPATMLECRHCGLHLPSDEAIQGQQGAYCTQAHRLLAEK